MPNKLEKIVAPLHLFLLLEVFLFLVDLISERKAARHHG